MIVYFNYRLECKDSLTARCVHRLIFSPWERGLRIWLDKKLILVLNEVLRDLQKSQMTD